MLRTGGLKRHCAVAFAAHVGAGRNKDATALAPCHAFTVGPRHAGRYWMGNRNESIADGSGVCDTAAAAGAVARVADGTPGFYAAIGCPQRTMKVGDLGLSQDAVGHLELLSVTVCVHRVRV